MNEKIIERILANIERVNSKLRDNEEAYHALQRGFSECTDFLDKEAEAEVVEVINYLAEATRIRFVTEEKTTLADPPDYIQRLSRDKHKMEIFNSLFPRIECGLLKSRIGEILLLVSKSENHSKVNEIIEGYLHNDLTENHWLSGQRNHIIRAFQLSKTYNKQDHIKKIENKIRAYIKSHTPENYGISYCLFEFIETINFDSHFIETIITELVDIASFEKKQKKYDFAEKSFFLASKLYGKIKTEKKRAESLFESAECLFHEAEARSQVSPNRNLMAKIIYGEALQRYRSVPRKYCSQFKRKERMERCETLIRQHGEKAVNDMHTFKLPAIDIGQIAEMARAHVSGKRSLCEAILCLTGFNILPDIADKETEGRFIISDFAAMKYLVTDGRFVGQKRDDELNDNEYKRNIECYQYRLPIMVNAQIIPAIRTLTHEHVITFEFLKEICKQSPLICHDRVALTAKSLFLGFTEYFSESIYLLTPQIEHLIRKTLKMAGVNTAVIDDLGNETEAGLGTLLNKAEAKKILGDPLHFNLKVLFTEDKAYNLRNNVAHGLLDDNTSQGDEVIYAWWLYLKIIVMSLTSRPLFKMPLKIA